MLAARVLRSVISVTRKFELLYKTVGVSVSSRRVARSTSICRQQCWRHVACFRLHVPFTRQLLLPVPFTNENHQQQ